MGGLLTGISGGGTMWAALKTAKKAPKGSVILAMLPDTGERYLSTPLFAEIEADMNESELEIAQSTPSFQLVPGKDPVLQYWSDQRTGARSTGTHHTGVWLWVG